jgi:hypothetical protein
MEGGSGDPEVPEVWGHMTVWQTIYAHVISVNNGIPTDPKGVAELHKQIRMLGGINSIQRWLDENDPGHSRIEDIVGFDASLFEM